MTVLDTRDAFLEYHKNVANTNITLDIAALQVLRWLGRTDLRDIIRDILEIKHVENVCRNDSKQFNFSGSLCK